MAGLEKVLPRIQAQRKELGEEGCLRPGGHNSRTGPLNQRRSALAGQSEGRLVPNPWLPHFSLYQLGVWGGHTPKGWKRKAQEIWKPVTLDRAWGLQKVCGSRPLARGPGLRLPQLARRARPAEGMAGRTLALCEVRHGCLVTAPGQPPAGSRAVPAVLAALTPQLWPPRCLSSSCHHDAATQHGYGAAELLEGGVSEGEDVAL